MKKRYLIAGATGVAASAAIAARLLRRPADAVWDENRAAVFHAEHSKFIEVNGLRVHYQDVGPVQAPVIVLIHGFCSSTLVWSEVLLKLSQHGFRVIAPDLLGYGYSSKPRNGEYTIPAQARMIVGLLDKLDLKSAVVIGSSYGGAIAATLALDHPERLEKLILVGAVTNNEPTKYPLMRLFGSPLLGDLISPLLIGSRRLLRLRMKRAYDRHARVLDEKRVEARHLPLKASATHRAIVRTVRRWDANRIQREAHIIDRPTLLLWGENDQEVPLRDGERLQEQIRDSRLIVFRNCGHLPHEEFPTQFTEVVAEFCLDIANAGRPTELEPAYS